MRLPDLAHPLRAAAHGSAARPSSLSTRSCRHWCALAKNGALVAMLTCSLAHLRQTCTALPGHHPLTPSRSSANPWRLAVRPRPGCPRCRPPAPAAERTWGCRYPPVQARDLAGSSVPAATARCSAFVARARCRRRPGRPEAAARLVGSQWRATTLASSSVVARGLSARRGRRTSAAERGLLAMTASRSSSPTVRLAALFRLTARVVRGLDRASLTPTPALPSGKAPAVRRAP